jgi:hypothetical protein
MKKTGMPLCKTIRRREGVHQTPRVPQHNIATKMRPNMWKESNNEVDE